MRIRNKYLRNRLVKTKARQRTKKFLKDGEFSFKAYMPYMIWRNKPYGYDEQLKDHQEYIDEYWVRNLTDGGPGLHAPRWYRNIYQRSYRRQVKKSITKIMQGEEDIEIPTIKYNADWDWF